MLKNDAAKRAGDYVIKREHRMACQAIQAPFEPEAFKRLMLDRRCPRLPRSATKPLGNEGLRDLAYPTLI